MAEHPPGLPKAAEMEAAGVDAERIGRETGWSRGGDGTWRPTLADALSAARAVPPTADLPSDLAQALSVPGLSEIDPGATSRLGGGAAFTTPSQLGEAKAVLPSAEWERSMMFGKPMESTPEWLKGAETIANYGSLSMPLGIIRPSVAGRIREIGGNKMTGEQWRGILKNKGVPAEELGWLDPFLTSKAGEKLTAADLVAEAEARQPKLTPVWKGGELPKIPFEEWYRQTHVQPFEGLHPRTQDLIRGDYVYEGQNVVNRAATKFDQWQVPGGTNYREEVFTLPVKSSAEGDLIINYAKTLHEKYGERWSSLATDAEKQHYDDLIVKQERLSRQPELDNYRSAHWDEPNPLAHVRMNDRMLPGGKTLFIEEFQSDWHQAGRKQGYQPADIGKLDARRREIENLGRNATPEQKQEWVDIMNKIRPDSRDIEGGSRFKGVPDAPYKKTWPDLLLDEVVQYAADHGYDQIAWTDGATQAARYDLSKYIDQIGYQKRGGLYNVKVWDKNGRVVWHDQSATPDMLEANVGKEMTQKIIDGAGRNEGGPSDLGPLAKMAAEKGPDSWEAAQLKYLQESEAQKFTYLEGLDLKVGGEGMNAFYDKMMPNKANQKYKKYGAQVRQETMRTPNEPNNPPGFQEKTIHVMPLTPALKKQAALPPP